MVIIIVVVVQTYKAPLTEWCLLLTNVIASLLMLTAKAGYAIEFLSTAEQ